MAEIAYPTTIKTDYDKLCAVYSLIEQMRLEHNRQGALARGDWPKYKDKWYLYALRPRHLGGNIFSEMLEPLLQEQNRLRDSIRASHYTKEQWKALPEEDRDAAFVQLFGDKQELKVKPTKATSKFLDELKAIPLDGINGSVPPDPTEDFTTYTETDSDGDLTVTASKIDIDTMLGNAVSHVVKDKGAGHFGDFEHLEKVVITSVTNSSARRTHIYHSLSNIGNPTWGNLDTADEGLCVYCYIWVGWPRVVIRDFFDNAEDIYSGAGECPQTYYLTIERNGTTATCKVYSDADRTNLLDTVTITCQTTTYQYISALGSGGYYENESVTGSNEALDLQETGGETEKTSSDSGAGLDAKSMGNPAVIAAGAEIGSGIDVKVDYPSGEITGSESGAGSDVAILLAAIVPAGDSGFGVEESYLDITGYISKVGSDSGIGSEIGAAIIAQVIGSEVGGGVESVMDRVLMLAESGSGVESCRPVVVWTTIDAGAGVEASTLVPVFFSSDMGLGSEFSIMLKDICGDDGGSGFDALKALIGTMGPSSDMSLHGRSGKVRRPSKGVNL